MKRLAIFLSLSVLAALAASPTANADILQTDFSSVTGLQLNGSATQSGSALRVTPALTGRSGSALSTRTVSLASDASFGSAFKFQITTSGGI